MKKPLALNFKVREYLGCELYDDQAWLPGGELCPLKNESDLVEGRKVITQGLTGLIMATIKKNSDGSFYLKSGGLRCGSIRFNEDDRHCWVALGWYNAAALAQLHVT